MRKHRYRLVSNQEISPSTRLITLEKDDQRTPFTFFPGQYAGLSFTEGSSQSPVRCFSIVNSPDQENFLQFGIKEYGPYTRSIASIQAGTVFIIYGPYGSFVLPKDPSQPLVFVAGGIGITPFISMLRYAADHKLPTPIRLLYSNRSADDIPFAEELAELASRNPNFQFTVYVTQKSEINPNPNIVYKKINPEDLISLTISSYPKTVYFVCGPPGFKEYIVQSLKDQNVEDNNIIVESFGQAANSKSGNNLAVKSVYYGTALVWSLAFIAIALANIFKSGSSTSSASTPVNNIPKTASSPSTYTYSLPNTNSTTTPTPDPMNYTQPYQNPRSGVS